MQKTHEHTLCFLFALFLLINFFFPAWATDYGLYYCNLIVANVCALGLILYASRTCTTRPSQSPAIWALLGIAAIYLLANLFFSALRHRWFWDFINKAVSLLFFLFLAFKLNPAFIRRHRIIEMIILIGALSSLASILFYLAGYDDID